MGRRALRRAHPHPQGRVRPCPGRRHRAVGHRGLRLLARAARPHPRALRPLLPSATRPRFPTASTGGPVAHARYEPFPVVHPYRDPPFLISLFVPLYFLFFTPFSL